VWTRHSGPVSEPIPSRQSAQVAWREPLSTGERLTVAAGLVVLAALLVGGYLWFTMRWTDAVIHDWREVSDGVELGVGTCRAEHTVDVTETADEVRVRVRARNDTTDDCMDLVLVALITRVGDRAIDRATGEVVDTR
jgi:hypothetical protein